MAFVANSVAGTITGQVSLVGQSILRPLGFSGIPTFNVDNACAGSSSAVNLAMHALMSGAADTVLVVGAEKMFAPDRTMTYRALNGAVDLPTLAATGIDPGAGSVFVGSIYPQRVERYRAKWGLHAEDLAAISVKNRAHAAFNPDAQYTVPLTIDEVLDARLVADPITMLMCAPVSDGAAALILTTRPPASDWPTVWVRGSAIGMGAPLAEVSSIARVAARAYGQAGIGPAQVDVAEVHDSISFNELVAYEELGLVEEGGGPALVREGVTTLGGRLPVNTSGGLESRGHPMGATGAAQIAELTRQLRGEAGHRQVAGARWAVAENAGGFVLDDTGAIAVTVLSTEAA
jgi:acetyl-CoA acetyltransferase